VAAIALAAIHASAAGAAVLPTGRPVAPAGRISPLQAYPTGVAARPDGKTVLAIAGPVVQPPPPHDDIVVPGVLGDDERWGALEGAAAFVRPSPAESFGIVLLEAWTKAKPVLVNGLCTVTAGHARRSGGGLAYRDYADFEAALEILLGEPQTAATLGAKGQAYAGGLTWGSVMDRYQSFLERVAGGWATC